MTAVLNLYSINPVRDTAVLRQRLSRIRHKIFRYSSAVAGAAAEQLGIQARLNCAWCAARAGAQRSPLEVLREENQLLKETIANAENDTASLEGQLGAGAFSMCCSSSLHSTIYKATFCISVGRMRELCSA